MNVFINKHSLHDAEPRCLDMKLRCFTCLSFDRDLRPLKEKTLMATFCQDIFLNPTFSAQYMICWECEAVINRIREFKIRVFKAHYVLTRSDKTSKFVPSLSCLKRTPVEILTIESQTLITTFEEPMTVEDKDPQINPTIVKIESGNQHSHYSDDCDKFTQLSVITSGSSGESTETASETESTAYEDPLTTTVNKPTKDFLVPIQIKRIKEEFPASHENVAINVSLSKSKVYTHTIKTKPQNIIRGKIISRMRGLKESVKVTSTNSALVVVTPKLSPKSDSKICNSNRIKAPTSESKLNNSTVPTKSVVENQCETLLGFYGFHGDEVECKLLNLEELLKYREGKQNQRLFKGLPFKCDRCLEKFNTKKRLDAHNKKHDQAAGSFVCDICEQRFQNTATRDLHYNSHFIVFECIKCGWQNHDRAVISNHIRTIHQVGSFPCKSCTAIFNTYKERKKHRLKHHYKKPICSKCGKQFSSRGALKHHMDIHLAEYVMCPRCKRKILGSRMEAHMQSHDTDPDISTYCAECNIFYKSKSSYVGHLKKSLKHNSIEKFGLKCEQCDKSFAVKKTLLDHIEVEHEKTAVCVCDVCKKEYKSKRRLELHIRREHTNRMKPAPKMCELCGKSYSCKKSFSDHLNSHLGLRPHKCQDCGDTFPYAASLYTHRRLVHKVKRKSEKTS